MTLVPIQQPLLQRIQATGVPHHKSSKSLVFAGQETRSVESYAGEPREITQLHRTTHQGREDTRNAVKASDYPYPLRVVLLCFAATASGSGRSLSLTEHQARTR